MIGATDLFLEKWRARIRADIPLVTNVRFDFPDEESVLVNCWCKEALVATFTLSYLPGCRGVIVFHGMKVMADYQNQKVATKLQAVKRQIVNDLQVTAMMATVNVKNQPQQKVMSHGWEKVWTFTNPKTTNKINVFFTHVKREAK